MATQPPDVSSAGHREACATEEFEHQLDRLSDLLAASGATDPDKLTNDAGDADGIWETQRDETCEAAAAAAEFGMAPAIQATCLMHLTAQRANEIARSLDRGK